jgi:predicted nucleotidyltransferase
MAHIEVPIDLHKELNPRLWNNDEIKLQVQVALLKIARVYYDFLSLDVAIVDVVVSGSQANYNYTEHSDIDLHLIVNYNDVECDMAVDELFDTKRKLWKEQHDIEIYGMPVEVYVEDTNKPAVSSTYSLLKNKWIKPPAKPVVEFNEADITRIATKWMHVITGVLKTQDLEQIEMVKNLLWAYRKAGLAKQGEFGTANLVFKFLRNIGASTRLLDAQRHLKDQSLSI